MSLFDEKNLKNTSISEIGEFALIDILTKDIEYKNKNIIKGIGDDAAVIDVGKKSILVSTDMLIEGVHFDLSYTPLKHLGYKAVSVNISDICSMNGQAKYITVGLALSNRFSVESLEELYLGIRLACERYGVDLIGGDTTSSTTGLAISITAVGEVKGNSITYRNGAKINDLLVVSGDLGSAYLGLQLLKREKGIFIETPNIQPDLAGNDYVLQRQLKAEARVDIIEKLKRLKLKPTSMIDISDGLSSEALHISKESKVGVQIYENKIPIDTTAINLSEELNLNPILCALNGGEDYELLFTVDQKAYKKIKDDVDFTIIGHISEESVGNNFIAQDGSAHKLTAQGWDSTNL